MTPRNEVVFGWGAPPVKEQHPILSSHVAHHFDEDNKALMRLSIRGYLTDSQKNAAIKKMTARIGSEIRKALNDAA